MYARTPHEKLLLCEMLECDNTEESLSSDSDDEEEIVAIVSTYHKKENIRHSIKDYFESVFPEYNDTEFKVHFRASRRLFVDISQKIQESEWFRCIKSTYNRVSAPKQMALFLWFAGHESCSFRDIGDRFNLSLWSVHHIIKRVTMFISQLSPSIIIWPNYEGMMLTMQHYRRKQMPNVIGLIDGTHILIDPPKKNPDEYIDRKGYTSIVVQGVCNYNKKFINVFVGYPGSTHDSRVLRNSTVNEKFLVEEEFYLLGDSTYPCLPWLMVPYRDNGHLTQSQKRFNKVLSSCRVAIEHTFGLLKQRFRQLYYCKLRGLKTLCHFIRACCVLHNLADLDDLELFDAPSEEHEAYGEWDQ